MPCATPSDDRLQAQVNDLTRRIRAIEKGHAFFAQWNSVCTSAGANRVRILTAGYDVGTGVYSITFSSQPGEQFQVQMSVNGGVTWTIADNIVQAAVSPAFTTPWESEPFGLDGMPRLYRVRQYPAAYVCPPGDPSPCFGTLTFTPTPPSTISVLLVADPETVAPSGASTLTATVINGDGVSGVTWSIVSGTGTLGSETAFGAVYTAAVTLESSSAVIRATSVEDPTKFDDVTVTVTYVVPPISDVYIFLDASSLAGGPGTEVWLRLAGDYDGEVNWGLAPLVLAADFDGDYIGGTAAQFSAGGVPPITVDTPPLTLASEFAIIEKFKITTAGWGASSNNVLFSVDLDGGDVTASLMVNTSATDGATVFARVTDTVGMVTYDSATIDMGTEVTFGALMFLSLQFTPTGPSSYNVICSNGTAFFDQTVAVPLPLGTLTKVYPAVFDFDAAVENLVQVGMYQIYLKSPFP